MTTLNLQVSASADDASETSGGVVSTNATTSTITSASAWLGFRVLNVTIPQGSIINSAVPQVYAQSTANDNPAFNVHCEAADNPGTFTTGANDISSRSRTTANVAWTGTDVGTGFKTLPDIKTVWQEVINRAGFVSGNAVNHIFDATTGVSFTARMYDHTTTDAFKIDVDYTPPGHPALRRFGHTNLLGSIIQHRARGLRYG